MALAPGSPDGSRPQRSSPKPPLPGDRLGVLERARTPCAEQLEESGALIKIPDYFRPAFNQNRIYCAIVALAVELTAWMQMLSLNDHDARRWEPKRLRLRLFTIPATIARTGRRVRLHLAAKAPWADLLDTAVQQLRVLPAAPG